MKFVSTKPCNECPFTMRGFSLERLRDLAGDGFFHCHKTGATEKSDEGPDIFVPTPDSVVCAGMLIFNEKRGQPNQMMRICERLGQYDRTKLDMKSKVI